ncbi:pyrophosphatase PpaX [Paenibacillus sp. J2TS4]|uniref:pyrophosphatase PpaX n=1 Tax=Paenibacillus sp. J2TS4 TaxID=2807194 RepID=UPI001B077FA3|nr:pyrophosphatase PpaX [Paenibacillus sp. J2TS4]GIP34283.1 pyrophosphatase PpaX [Paenibacillus sp. J2TS4]
MIKTILFDLDGTIINTNELIMASFIHALEGRTKEAMTREQMIPYFGEPLVDQIKRFSGLDQVDDLVEKYRHYNVTRHDDLTTEFPYVKEVIAQLYEDGIRMGVVTTKMKDTAYKGLELFDLDPYMQVVVALNDVKAAKPDPEGILLAMRELGADPQSTLMVGDSQYDIMAAQNAGIRAAGVAWSIKGREFLSQFNPDYMLNDIRELLDLAAKRDRS